MSKSLRLIYAGTPEFSVPALQALHAAGHDIVAVLTQPDRPAGRGQKMQASPVKQAALELNLNVLQPLSLRKAHSKKEIRALKADAMIVAAYGLILPQSVLDMPRLGCLNIHASLLPRWRGAAPIHRAIEAGDELTGITIMQMDAGLDTGDILSAHTVKITADDTSQSLHNKLSTCGADAIVDSLKNLEAGLISPQIQDAELANYAHKLHKSEAKINWSESVEVIERKIRAFNPWPCAFSKIKGKNLKIWRAEIINTHQVPSDLIPIGKVIACSSQGIQVQTGQGILNLLEIQMAGKKRLPVEQFVNATDLSLEIFNTSDE